MLEYLSDIAKVSGKLTNIRGVGAMVAADMLPVGNRRIGHEVAQYAMDQGALIRPIGNTLYWLPPLNTDEEIIGKLAEITLNSINKAYKNINNNGNSVRENSECYL
jgi:adenosylmethionine-8-amino-7-oxononanoate aminotransferase